MARELVIKIRCDFCSKDVPESEAYSGELILKGAFYEIDLCPECAPTLTSRLTAMPASQASIKTTAVTRDKPGKTKYPSTPKKDRKTPCPICGANCKNDLGVKFHIAKMHPNSVTENGTS
jgi:hypothetical protein